MSRINAILVIVVGITRMLASIDAVMAGRDVWLASMLFTLGCGCVVLGIRFLKRINCSSEREPDPKGV